MEQGLLDWGPERRVFTVSEITAGIRGLLNAEFSDVWVSGEISGLKLAPSGHAYFTLKDEGAQVRCACFRNAMRLLKFKPQDGVAVVARGRVDVYEPRGEYQFIVEVLEPQGFGALQLAFEQLKRRLEAEGLFAPERKRPLPKFPSRIGIVTSASGAAIQDMLHILSRRFPGLHIRLYPALVQGAGSVEAVVEGIDYFSRGGWAEVVIAGRGGGSLEDLWTFNEEPVARAIAASSVPVISAVGHETDFTIADFVADLRAPTPSAAAELVVRERAEILEALERMRRQLERAFAYTYAKAAQRVDEMDYRLREQVRARMDRLRRFWHDLEARLRRRDLRLATSDARRRLDVACGQLAGLAQRRLSASRTRLDRARTSLDQLSPLAVLERGYAIVETAEGRVVREASAVVEGADLDVLLRQGRLGVRVTRTQG